MTLMNGLTTGDRAALWTDTLWLDPYSGEPVAYGPKGLTCQLFPGAVVTTTIGGNPMRLLDMIDDRAPLYLGALLDACEFACREFVKAQPEIAAARVLVAGWCDEMDLARLFVISSDVITAGQRPFEAIELQDFLHDMSHPAIQAARSEGLTVEKMRHIADIQRTIPIKPDKGGFEPMMGIGGQLIECEVTRAGTTSRVVKDWGTALPIAA